MHGEPEQGVFMNPANNERSSGDHPLAPTTYGDETRPMLAHQVIATYVADAARSVPGVADLHVSAWKGLSSRVRETHSDGVVIRENDDSPVDVEIHVRVAWGTYIPDLAALVENAVRDRVTALLSIDLGTVTLYVDEIEGPAEVETARES
jgi:uncharacterized alkaline shock family protein YloU